MSRSISSDQGNMLLRFEATNVRSFRDRVELSLLATRLAEKGASRSVEWREGGHQVDVLPSAVVFGANASGKTNVLRAMYDLRQHVLFSFRKGNPTGGIPRRPFMLDPSARSQPSRFELDIALDGIRHRYGVELDDRRVVAEWAFKYTKGQPARIFERVGDEVKHGSGTESQGRQVAKLLRSNALFLSTAAAGNHQALLPLYNWFDRNFLLADETNRSGRQHRTAVLASETATAGQVLDLLQAADLGVANVRVDQEQIDAERARSIRRALHTLHSSETVPDLDETDSGPIEISTLRLEHQGSTEPVPFDQEDESLGTLVWLGMIGPVIDALSTGSVLLADEIDTGLHPALIKQIVGLFQNVETNPNGAQLIFNCHDATLLGDSTGSRPIGRDQIWFSEKDPDGNTRLYSLADFDPRKEESIYRRYLEGRYGAVPIMSHHDFAAAVEAVVDSNKK